MIQQIIGNWFHLTIRILSPEILFKQILLKNELRNVYGYVKSISY